MLGKLFGGKKSDYFLELKEDKTAVTAKPVEEPKAEVATPVAVEEPPAEVVTETAPQKSKKTKSKKVKTETPKSEPTSTEPVAVTPVVANGKTEPQEVEFATKYLITPSLSRRLPGPSLSAFKGMARQVKKPIIGKK